MSDNGLKLPASTPMKSTSATSEFCFVAGVLHQRWLVMDHGDADPYAGPRYEWRPVLSFETMEEAEKA